MHAKSMEPVSFDENALVITDCAWPAFSDTHTPGPMRRVIGPVREAARSFIESPVAVKTAFTFIGPPVKGIGEPRSWNHRSRRRFVPSKFTRTAFLRPSNAIVPDAEPPSVSVEKAFTSRRSSAKTMLDFQSRSSTPFRSTRPFSLKSIAPSLPCSETRSGHASGLS